MAKDGKRTPTDRSYRGPRPRRDKTVEKKIVDYLLESAVLSEAARTTGRGCSRVRLFRLSNLPRTGSAPTMRKGLNRQEDHVVG
jgi:hypothetical protein